MRKVKYAELRNSSQEAGLRVELRSNWGQNLYLLTPDLPNSL
jgi:hypothetical protein